MSFFVTKKFSHFTWARTVLCLSLISLSQLTACMQNGQKPKLSALTASPSPSPSSSYAVTILTPGNVTILANAQPAPVARFSFPSGDTKKMINLFCDSNNAKYCFCRYNWTQSNTMSGALVSIPRQVDTLTSNSQNFQIDCLLPPNYNSEVDDRTKVKISILPQGYQSGGQYPFSVTPMLVQKNNTIPEAGTVLDQDGRGFDPIRRYVCFAQFNRGTQIFSEADHYSDSGFTDTVNGQNVTYSYDLVRADRFCFFNASGAMSGNCQNQISALSSWDPFVSSQSYSFNFYARSNNPKIYPNNQRFQCIAVDPSDALVKSETNPNLLFPYDSQFMLAVNKSQFYDQPVQALRSPEQTGGGVISEIIGYAAPARRDGSCPSFKSTDKDANGNYIEKPMYRLRQYLAIFPDQLDTNGLQQNGVGPSQDLVYVIDRPAYDSDGKLVGTRLDDGTKMATAAIQGPLPCPFSYFDQEGVTNNATNPSRAGTYVATNDPAWDNKNVDGTHLPNRDLPDNFVDQNNARVPTSCAASIALYDQKGSGSNATTIWSVGTSHANNGEPAMRSVIIGPQQHWSPRYRENIDFRACAPFTPPPYYVEAPVQHYKGTGVGAWCAKILPNSIPTYPGKGSVNGESFPSTITGMLKSGDPEAPRRLVPTQSDCDNKQPSSANCANALKRRRYNLVAPAYFVDKALSSEPTYQCRYTFDSGQGKVGIKTPPAGCSSSTSFSGASGHHEPIPIPSGSPVPQWSPPSW